jgi:hypothetical protein
MRMWPLAAPSTRTRFAAGHGPALERSTTPGTVPAPNGHTAVLDAISAIRAESPDIDRVRFAVKPQINSPFWR